ncbi:MAG: ABC transporter permease subunit [Promethearchaeota archaeon]
MTNEVRIFKIKKKPKFKIKKIYLNLIYTFIIGIALYFLAINLSFFISRILPGDPVLAYLPPTFTQQQYDQMYHQLGYDRPIFEQYLRYIINMFSGNWGFSLSINRGMPTMDFFRTRAPRTIDIILLPLLVGTILGVLFGNLSIKIRKKWLNKSFQLLTLFGLAIPSFFLGMLFQYFLGYLIPMFPTIGYKTFSYGDPDFVTGFRILDSLISGELYYIPDYLYHLVLPWSILTLGIGCLITLLTRLYLINKAKRRSIVPNSFNYGIGFGVIFANLMLIETTFGLFGIFDLLIAAIMFADYWVINAIIFLIPLIFVIFLVVTNLLFIIYGLIKPPIVRRISSRRSKNPKTNPQANKLDPDVNKSNPNTNSNQMNTEQKRGFKKQLKDFGNYLYKKAISPFTIIGSLMLLFFILISIFPQILTPYTFEEANGIFAGAWSPPSPAHPLGQAQFGRDVLARIVYGVRTSLITVLIPIGIGLVGGLICGIPMSLLNRRFKMSSEISMIIFFIYPMIIGLMFSVILLGLYLSMYMLTLGLLLVPFFTILIAKTRLNLFEILKKLIPYLPLFIGFVLLVDLGFGFLGFIDPRIISIGADISEARMFLYMAPYASLLPGLFIFLLIISFFLLYSGLQKSPREL